MWWCPLSGREASRGALWATAPNIRFVLNSDCRWSACCSSPFFSKSVPARLSRPAYLRPCILVVPSSFWLGKGRELQSVAHGSWRAFRVELVFYALEFLRLNTRNRFKAGASRSVSSEAGADRHAWPPAPPFPWPGSVRLTRHRQCTRGVAGTLSSSGPASAAPERGNQTASTKFAPLTPSFLPYPFHSFTGTKHDGLHKLVT